MSNPKIMRPQFPAGYVENPQAFLSWNDVEEKLASSLNYWLCSTRPDGRPHVIPRWAVMIAGKIYYDGSPETRHAKNISQNSKVTVHLESGTEAVIVDGDSKAIERPSPGLAEKIATAYREKYAELGYSPEPNQWDDGGLYVFVPRKAIAWTSFMEDPTKYVFEE